MDRDIPTFNQLIVNKINEKNLIRHQQRLSEIKAAQRSRIYAGSSLNSRANKKAQMLEEEKKTQIEKSNLMLFNKMRNIMGRADPRNKPNNNQTRKQGRYSMEFTRIQEQNRTMYERIEGQRPTINNKKLQQQRQKQLNVLKFLGKYSAHSIQTANPNLRNSYASTRQQTNDLRLKASINQYNTQAISSKQQYQEEHFPFDEEIDDEDFERLKKMIEAKQKKINLPKPQTHHATKEQETASPSPRKIKQLPSIPRSAKDIILFKTSRIISQNLFDIRIVRSHQHYQIRCNISGQPQQGLCLRLDENEGNQLLQSNNYDYKTIIESICIKNGKIQLGHWQTQQQEEQEYQQESKAMTSQNSNKNVPSFAQSRQSNFAYANSSHISELNEEDSYHIQMREEKPTVQIKNQQLVQEDRIDSLGDQQRFQQYTAKQVEHVNKNVEDLVQKPIKFQEKLHALQFQSPVFEQYPPSKQTAEQSELIEVHKGSYRAHQKSVGRYEQALDQYID